MDQKDNDNGNNNDDGGKERTKDDTRQNIEFDERKSNFADDKYSGEIIQPKDNVEVVSTTEKRKTSDASETVNQWDKQVGLQDKRTSQTTETRSGEDESRCQGWAWSTSRRIFFSVTIPDFVASVCMPYCLRCCIVIRVLASKTQQGDINVSTCMGNYSYHGRR